MSEVLLTKLVNLLGTQLPQLKNFVKKKTNKSKKNSISVNFSFFITILFYF